MANIPLGRDAYLSLEFQAFAQIWLGFDPHDPDFIKVQRYTVRMDSKEAVSYKLKCLAESNEEGEE